MISAAALSNLELRLPERWPSYAAGHALCQHSVAQILSAQHGHIYHQVLVFNGLAWSWLHLHHASCIA